MMPTPRLDADLLRRYDHPAPRYTSYPTVPQFVPNFSATDFQQAATRSNEDPIPRPLSLYAHIPFCLSPCFYCGCTRVITRNRHQGAAYLDRVIAQIGRIGALFDRDRQVLQLHLGGGTPNFLDPGQIGELIDGISKYFSLSTSADRDFSIELDPRSISSDDIAALGWIGFNRASLGVQDFDPLVQKAVNRIQDVEQTLSLIDACRTAGFRSINIDLIYGLPKQTIDGFAKTLQTILKTRPDRLAIYSYAHLPNMFRGQSQINNEDLPDAMQKLDLLRLSVEQLSAAGYRHIGMDHFALPEDELSQAQIRGDLHRNFMGYTTHADCDLVDFGMSAISRIGDCFSQNARTLPEWQHAIDACELAIYRGLKLDDDDLLREEVIQSLMCQGLINIAMIEANYAIEFNEYFADSLKQMQPLIDDGLVQVSQHQIHASEQGRWLLRHIAMCFDKYHNINNRVQYSKAI